MDSWLESDSGFIGHCHCFTTQQRIIFLLCTKQKTIVLFYLFSLIMHNSLQRIILIDTHLKGKEVELKLDQHTKLVYLKN